MHTISNEKLSAAKLLRQKALIQSAFMLLIILSSILLMLCILLKESNTVSILQSVGVSLEGKKNNMTIFLIIALLLAANFSLYYLRLIRLKFQVQFKELVMHAVVQEKYPKLYYSPTAFVGVEKYNSSGHSLFKYTQYEGEDFLQGEYQGVAIEMSQLTISQGGKVVEYSGRVRTTTRTTRNGRVKKVSIFKGVFATIATTHFDIDAFVEVLPAIMDKKFPTGVLGSDNEDAQPAPQRYKIAANPSSGFNNLYSVYTNSESTARRLLSPELSQFLIQQAEKQQYIYLSFHPEAIYLSMPSTKDFLKIGLFSQFDEQLFTQYQTELENTIGTLETIINLLPKNTNV